MASERAQEFGFLSGMLKGILQGFLDYLGYYSDYGVLQGLLQEFSGSLGPGCYLYRFLRASETGFCAVFRISESLQQGFRAKFHGSGPRGGTKVGRVSVVPYDIPRPSPKHPT